MYLKLTQGSYSSLFLFSNLFCPSPRLGQPSWCFIILPRAYCIPFIIIYQFIQSKEKDTNVCRAELDICDAQAIPSSPGLCPLPSLLHIVQLRSCGRERDGTLAWLCNVKDCSFPSAAQDREHLICKISILLQAEIYILALFLKVIKTNHSA